MARPITVAPPPHRALVAKVDAFDVAVRTRRAADMACRAGCSACCGQQLSVCDVEAALLREGIDALDDEARAGLALRLETVGPESACVFLDAAGRCAVYASRPLVCRTQGLPLRYPNGVIPVSAVFLRRETVGSETVGSDVTWCPLNFRDAPPSPPDVIDAARVDTMLALSNRDAGGDAERRTPLAELARAALSDSVAR
ncbi:MAG: YkgJ family cysteine cluster protein [Deltaproteobacteria bacterium]|nr:YkgJ family cysteine cluster protein [Deltaproteobacteria bacterium]